MDEQHDGLEQQPHDGLDKAWYLEAMAELVEVRQLVAKVASRVEKHGEDIQHIFRVMLLKRGKASDENTICYYMAVIFLFACMTIAFVFHDDRVLFACVTIAFLFHALRM